MPPEAADMCLYVCDCVCVCACVLPPRPSGHSWRYMDSDSDSNNDCGLMRAVRCIDGHRRQLTLLWQTSLHAATPPLPPLVFLSVLCPCSDFLLCVWLHIFRVSPPRHGNWQQTKYLAPRSPFSLSLSPSTLLCLFRSIWFRLPMPICHKSRYFKSLLAFASFVCTDLLLCPLLLLLLLCCIDIGCVLLCCVLFCFVIVIEPLQSAQFAAWSKNIKQKWHQLNDSCMQRVAIQAQYANSFDFKT